MGNLGVIFAQLKKLRNDINRKMRGLVGKDMVTESWLCMEVLSLLPMNLRRVFKDRSRKEISMLNENRHPVTVNVARKFTGKSEPRGYPSNHQRGGHWKKACPVLAADRDPKRFGGELIWSNIRSAPVAKKKRAMMVKKRVKATTGKVRVDQDEESTPAEAAELDL
ncbi:hypothetical protein PC119_g23246 [Phytophthora cactorum]|nr:hypothetical protein PC112_g20763 [Phytophthora cactorum]KAG2878805.1 hypothetical protein PC114_g22894 [Phytophthora cactorum]KAG2972089.1 hypothetical protein PC119_g23246 [Phytophthora cactorum]KAG3129815.1 hypothetical protein C6341_g23998 [Phytophthora cactorum]KAG4041016.1 hypothetical protein PC123_g23455 [Phytophthora cactorum]